jgi:hypothetical protein
MSLSTLPQRNYITVAPKRQRRLAFRALQNACFVKKLVWLFPIRAPTYPLSGRAL